MTTFATEYFGGMLMYMWMGSLIKCPSKILQSF